MAFEVLEGEREFHRSKANAVIVPSDYGLSEFAAGDLLGLAGIKGKEAIGGHLHVTSLRMAFEAHGFNRVKGVLSVPLSAIRRAVPWRAGLSVGIQVTTDATALQIVSWSRKAVLLALEEARSQFGPTEEAHLRSLASVIGDLEVRPAAEIGNLAARALFELADDKPSALGLLSRIEFKSVIGR